MAGYSESGSWKNVCSCDALAAGARVVEHQPAGADVPGSHERRGRGVVTPAARQRASTRRLRSLRSQPPYATPRRVVPQPIEAHQRVGGGGGGQHLELEGIVEARVHELEREPDAGAEPPRPDPAGHLAQPAEDAAALVGQRVAGERGREVLLHRQRARAPCARQARGGVPVLRVAERLVEPRKVVLDRGHGEQLARPGQLAGGADQGEVVVERAVPAPALPGDRPAARARRRPAAARPASWSRGSPRRPSCARRAASSAITVLSTTKARPAARSVSS